MTATNSVQDIFGTQVILKERLGGHYPADSRVYQ